MQNDEVREEVREISASSQRRERGWEEGVYRTLPTASFNFSSRQSLVLAASARSVARPCPSAAQARVSRRSLRFPGSRERSPHHQSPSPHISLPQVCNQARFCFVWHPGQLNLQQVCVRTRSALIVRTEAKGYLLHCTRLSARPLHAQTIT